MITKIDWLSFSVPFEPLAGGQAHRLLDRVGQTFTDTFPTAFDAIINGHNFEQRKGRAPYSVGYERDDHGAYIFAHPSLTHFLVEVTGKGCDQLNNHENCVSVCWEVINRLTRIDVACDMLCETSPLDFVAQRAEGRFKSHSEFVSDSGTTAYIGSRTSNRYARVYRYNAPHERAHLLRAEHVLKSEDAKLTMAAILNESIEAVSVSLGEKFGWMHSVWTPGEIQPAEIQTWRAERHDGKTMFWLNSTVAKTLVRLAKETDFSPQEWLTEFVLKELAPPDWPTS